jgi:hypothetical protein
MYIAKDVMSVDTVTTCCPEKKGSSSDVSGSGHFFQCSIFSKDVSTVFVVHFEYILNILLKLNN